MCRNKGIPAAIGFASIGIGRPNWSAFLALLAFLLQGRRSGRRPRARNRGSPGAGPRSV